MPILRAFAPRFLEGHVEANRQKPSSIAATESILRVHLVPMLGAKRPDAINNEEVQRLKASLQPRAAKTVNNVLTVLNTLLKTAVEWEVIDQTPCRVRLLPIPPREAPFHDFDQFERLVEAACDVDPRAYLIALLGGEAGLRCGEMMALEWPDLDLAPGQLAVRGLRTLNTARGRVANLGAVFTGWPATAITRDACRHRRYGDRSVGCTDGTPR